MAKRLFQLRQESQNGISDLNDKTITRIPIKKLILTAPAKPLNSWADQSVPEDIEVVPEAPRNNSIDQIIEEDIDSDADISSMTERSYPSDFFNVSDSEIEEEIMAN